MARLLVLGTVASGKERRKWKATQIHVDGGSWGVEQYHVQPVVIFLHYFGTGPAQTLAAGVRAAVAELGKGPVPR